MQRRISYGQKLTIWIGSIAIALFTVTGLTVKYQWDRRYHALEQAAEAFPDRFHEMRSERLEAFNHVAEQLVNTNKTPKQIIDMLGGSITHEAEYGIFHKFVDDDYLIGVRIVYGQELDRDAFEYKQNGIIESARMMGSVEFGYIIFESLMEPLAPVAVRLPIESRIESTAKLLVVNPSGINLPLSVIPWLGVLVGAWIYRPARSLLLACSFWIVSMTGLVLMMSPSYRLLSETVSNDPLFWVLVMLLFSIGACILSRIEHRPDLSLCQACGYKLIGNATGVCPECGERIESQQQAHLERLANIKKPTH